VNQAEVQFANRCVCSADTKDLIRKLSLPSGTARHEASTKACLPASLRALGCLGASAPRNRNAPRNRSTHGQSPEPRPSGYAPNQEPRGSAPASTCSTMAPSANITPMVVGELPAAAQAKILESEEGWIVESGSVRLVVDVTL